MRWKRFVGVVAALVLVGGVASAATFTGGSPGTLAMDPGDSVHVTCPNQLAAGNATANALDLTCAPDPTTTTTSTTVAPTTTTVPPTTTTVPPTTTTTAAPSAFPNASNTGVPAGTVLTTYTGPTTITTCQTIDSKLINSGLDIRVGNGQKAPGGTPCVTIRNSKINGTIDMSYAGRNFGPTLLDHVEINAPAPGVGTLFDVYESNYVARFVNVHGGDGGFQCDGYCSISDSYAHDFVFVSPNHMDAFITNGAYGAPITLNHNSFLCNFSGGGGASGGCSADVGFYGDFSAITNMTVTNNLLRASQGQFYQCVYTGAFLSGKKYPTGNHLVWTGNTFERGASGKCGDAGPVADWQNGNSNVWSGNRWSDGAPLNE